MSREASSDTDTNSNWSLGAALGAATLASACCILPLALVNLGIGGAWLGILNVLEPYDGIFGAVAVCALGYAAYREWQMSRLDCECETSLSPVLRRSLLGVGTLVVLALLASPWLIAPSTSNTDQAVKNTKEASVQETATPTAFQKIVLKVEGMTCSSCSVTVRTALEGVKGVRKAEVTYEPPQAVVYFNPEKTSAESITQATKDAGYSSQPKTSP